MNLRKLSLGATLAGLVIGAVSSPAGAAEYKIDGGNSAVVFKVMNREVAFVYGRFNHLSGTITTDKVRKPTRMSFNVEIKARSVDSNNKKRDKHLKGADFLNTKSFPTITFESKQSRKLENDQWELTGELNLHGVKKELTIIFQQTGFKKMDRDTYLLGGEANFTVKRSDFGMDYMIPGIGDEVAVMVSIEAECKVIPSG